MKAVQDIVLTFTRGTELSIPPAPIVLVYLALVRYLQSVSTQLQCTRSTCGGREMSRRV
eukprot:COSAG01_NODE_4633_length_4853_cov_6.538332_8_plen_59_part_00